MEKELSSLHSVEESRAITTYVFNHLGISKLDRISEPNSAFNTEQFNTFDSILIELMSGKPLQYVLGKVDFHGMSFEVDERVLIPRPETEELIGHVRARVDSVKKGIDLGTGSGVIACSLKKEYPHAEIHATDISAEALLVARKNAEANHMNIHFHERDMADEQDLSTFDLVVSNPPYVPDKERSGLDAVVRHHEPHIALFTEDPLRFYQSIVGSCQQAVGQHVFVECHVPYAYHVEELFRASGFKATEMIPDLQGLPRFVHARR